MIYINKKLHTYNLDVNHYNYMIKSIIFEKCN